MAVSLLAAAVSGLVLQSGMLPRSAHVAARPLLRPGPDPRMGVYSNKHTSKALRAGWIDPVERDCTDRTGQIVATLGPASQSPEMLSKLIAAGVNVFRLNSSHRQPGQFEALVGTIRSEAAKQGKDVKILGDIQGPKFRCTMTQGDQPVPLAQGTTVELGLANGDNDPTRPGRITLSPTTEQKALMRGLKPGMKLLLDDGFMEVVVSQVRSAAEATVKVTIGGMLKSRKGINVPQLQIDCSALTVKDREDAAYLCGVGVDYIALSFAQRKEDIQVRAGGGRAGGRGEGGFSLHAHKPTTRSHIPSLTTLPASRPLARLTDSYAVSVARSFNFPRAPASPSAHTGTRTPVRTPTPSLLLLPLGAHRLDGRRGHPRQPPPPHHPQDREARRPQEHRRDPRAVGWTHGGAR
jgi:hypothetical protein